MHATKKRNPRERASKRAKPTRGAKFDSFGNKVTWFGYKLHLAVDTQSELPLVLEVTPAHVNDG
ncbi:transposase [Paenibacillus cisolokensis]|uniref:transposase n=1 Tax=Paenibacillus cisolokensis TaxID=1658519 RepID=UPI003D294CE0